MSKTEVSALCRNFSPAISAFCCCSVTVFASYTRFLRAIIEKQEQELGKKLFAMGEGVPERAQAPATSEAAPPAEATKDVTEEKAVAAPAPEEKPDDSKALAIIEKAPEPPAEKHSGSIDRDAVLAKVESEKKVALIKAWEDNEKSKAENKTQKKLSAITSWENTRKATVEAELKRMEEVLEKKKAEYAEKMKNKVALIHKTAEEKRAMVEAKKGEDLLKVEEMAAKYRIKGLIPKKVLGKKHMEEGHIPKL
ncbi:hypothetical protein Taro_038017 [Colocasia esculenta]|uniref:Remorin n=1 Tax=Colocasia esculenta TaxID=4460 RepID=A0A843W734_COLES|nr:hypothetical protein [Colocasia esculenta]